MTCKQARQLMSKYLENGLQENENVAFRSHLAVCPDCRCQAEEIGRALDFVRRVEPPSLPSNLRQAVLQQIQREAAVKRKRAFAPGFMQGAAAAAVFVLLVAGNVSLGVSVPRMNGDTPPVALKSPSVAQEYAVVSEEAPTPAAPDVRMFANTSEAQAEATAGDSRQTAEPATGITPTSANDSALEGTQPGRFISILRLALNMFLVPLFLAFSWQAVKKRREAHHCRTRQTSS